MALLTESDSVAGRQNSAERSEARPGNGLRNNYCAIPTRGWKGWLMTPVCCVVGHRMRHDPESDPMTVTCGRCGFSQEWYGYVCDGKPVGVQMPRPAPPRPPGFEAPGPWSDPPPLPNPVDDFDHRPTHGEIVSTELAEPPDPRLAWAPIKVGTVVQVLPADDPDIDVWSGCFGVVRQVTRCGQAVVTIPHPRRAINRPAQVVLDVESLSQIGRPAWIPESKVRKDRTTPMRIDDTLAMSIAVAAYRLTLNNAPFLDAVFHRIRKPRLGELVLETSQAVRTMDPDGFGTLVSFNADDSTGTVRVSDDRRVMWENATFFAVPTQELLKEVHETMEARRADNRSD